MGSFSRDYGGISYTNQLGISLGISTIFALWLFSRPLHDYIPESILFFVISSIYGIYLVYRDLHVIQAAILLTIPIFVGRAAPLLYHMENVVAIPFILIGSFVFSTVLIALFVIFDGYVLGKAR